MLTDIMSRPDYLDMMELLADRRVACRVSIADNLLPQMLDYINEWNLQFGVMPTPHYTKNIYGDDVEMYRHEDQYEVYLAKNIYDLRFTLNAETDDDYRYLGAVYGYPTCCVDAFYETWLGEAERCEKYLHLSHAIIHAIPKHEYQKIMTPELDNRVLSLFPCKFDCPAALKKAAWRAEFMKRHHDWAPEPTSFGGVDFAS